MSNSFFSTESGVGFTTGCTGPEIDISMVSFSAGRALRRGFPATEHSVDTDRECPLKMLNHFKIETEQLLKLMLETDTEVKAISLSQKGAKKKVASVETEIRILAKCNAKLLSSETRKEAKNTCTGHSFIEIIPIM